MNDPTQRGSSGRDVEAAVREIIRGATDPGHATAGPATTGPGHAAAPEEGPARAARPAPASAGPPGNGTVRPGSDDDGGAPPRLAGPLEAFLRHPFLVILPIIVLVGAAAAVGTQRDPEHTATARIQVGRDNVPPFYLQSVITGSQALAATYSRAAYAEPVIQDAARAAGVPVEDVRGNLDGYPVGGSTLIEVRTRSTSPRAAIAMANAGAQSLIEYIETLTRDTSQSRALFESYRKAQRVFHRADQRVRELIGRRGREAQLRRARLDADVARLRAEDFAGRYRAATAERLTASALDVISPAASTTSDRSDKLQELIVIGAVAGIVLGLGLALLRSNAQRLRAIRRG